MYQTKAQLSGIEMMLSSSQMSAEVMESMKGVNAVLGKVNDDMNVQDIQKMIRDFQKESEKFGMKTEMMQDAMEDAMGNANDDEAADEVYNQICAEQGLQMDG